MALAFPDTLLKFTSLSWQIREVSRSGGPSVLGSEQIVTGPAGRWYASLTLSVGVMAWNGSDELLAYRGFMARLRGRSGVVDLPYFDGRGPAQIAAFARHVPHSDETDFSDISDYAIANFYALMAPASMNATQVQITLAPGFKLQPGQVFTVPGGWMHEIAAITAHDAGGNHWTVEVSPWLREDFASAVMVNLTTPTSRMRLVGDDSGLLRIDAGQPWANPTIELVEAF